MGKTVLRIIVSNGVMTVINNPNSVQDNLTEFYKHLDDFYKINDEGLKVIEHNNKILEELRQFQMQSNPLPSNPQPMQQLSNDNSFWGDFVQRGNYSATHPQTQGIMDPDRWANFTFDIIKKTLWLVWNSFIGISHWLCLLICVAGIIAYIAGFKKGGVVSICSVLFYILLRLINMVIGG